MLSIDRRHLPSRRAFALGGTIMLLFVLMVLLLAVRSYFIWSSLPATAPRGISLYGHDQATYTGMKIGIWVAPILGPLLALGLAWFVGWLVSLMFGKSDDAGNIGAGLIMVALLALFGYGTYIVIAAQKNPPAQQQAQAANTPFGAPRPAVQQPAPVPQANPQAFAPSPDTAPQQIPTAPSPTPRPSPRPPVQPPQSTFDSQPAIAEFQKPLDDAIADVVAKVDKLLPQLARPYPHEIRIVNERLTAIADLRTSAAALSKTLPSAADDLRSKLVAAGAPSFEAQSIAFRWAHTTYNATPRQFGADALVRLCDKATEEAEFLRDNIAKWTVDSKGEYKSKDISFKSKADSNRFFVRVEAERKDFIKDQLQGK